MRFDKNLIKKIILFLISVYKKNYETLRILTLFLMIDALFFCGVYIAEKLDVVYFIELGIRRALLQIETIFKIVSETFSGKNQVLNEKEINLVSNVNVEDSPKYVFKDNNKEKIMTLEEGNEEFIRKRKKESRKAMEDSLPLAWVGIAKIIIFLFSFGKKKD